jgi:hypothetical protein
MKDMTSVTNCVMLRVMKNFWKGLQEYFNRDIFRYKKDKGKKLHPRKLF